MGGVEISGELEIFAGDDWKVNYQQIIKVSIYNAPWTTKGDLVQGTKKYMYVFMVMWCYMKTVEIYCDVM